MDQRTEFSEPLNFLIKQKKSKAIRKGVVDVIKFSSIINFARTL